MSRGSPWVRDVEALVAHVGDGDVVGPSGFHFVRAPMAQLRAVVAAGVSDLTYVSWGGGIPLELLLSHRVVRKVVFCFSSLDVFGLAPRFRRALEQRSVEVEERTALGFMKGLRAGMEQLPFEVMQDPVASDIRGGFARAFDAAGVMRSETSHAPVVATLRLDLDVFLLHAQRADDAGNIEVRGARGLDLLALFSAKKVVVTVEERVPTGSLGADRAFVLPRDAVTALALAPGGAWPTSCMPHYPADYRALQRVAALAVDAPMDGALAPPTPGRLDELRTIAELEPAAIVASIRDRAPRMAVSDTAIEPTAFTIDELMVSVIAHTVDDESVCSVGSVSPLATIAYLLAKHLWAPHATIMSSNGGYLDVASRPMSTITAELLDFRTAVAHVGSDDSYQWYYQRGRISHEVVSSAQVDRRGRTNTTWVRVSDDRWVRLPGQGGMADVADMHQRFFLYLPRHSKRTMVETVDFVSAARAFHGGQERTRYGYRPGPTTLVTNLGIFEYDVTHNELVLTHVHPGVDFDELQDATGWLVRRAERVATTAVPTAKELRVIREELDPLGVRRLEFVPSAERATLIDELLDSEEQALRRAVVPGRGTAFARDGQMGRIR